MKKFLYMVVVATLCGTLAATANPGDTTWVQANIANLTGYGNYDSTITFPAPGTTYRKVYMIFTLGKYYCPSYPCGDWDYTVQNFLMTPGGDTLELGRFITPYANAGAPRTPWTWQQHYVFDVTDYVSKLQNSATVRIAYSGYTGGFTANIKFAFIQGVPDRNVTGITRLWNGSFGYGGTPSINMHFPQVSETAPAGTNTADVKFTVTGHGSDANGCCEFMPHNYQVYLDGSSIATQKVWRADCGSNELYPQSGTWLYQRSNWCPGALVYPIFHLLPGVAAGDTFNTDIQFEPYSGGGSYTTEAHLLYYGPMNKTLDASLEQIIAPTIDENHFRENPVAGNPIVHVRNSGATTINTITFKYGIVDSTMQTFVWYGSLDSLQETDITLPSGLYQLNNIAGTNDTLSYIVQITSVNGGADDDTTNNTMTSKFGAAPRWPSTIKIWLRTNDEFISTDSTISETSWVIYDMYGNIFAQRSHAHINTFYVDTITFPPGYYQLAVYDSSCDGLHWWVYDNNPGLGVNAGYIMVKQLAGANIPLHGNTYVGTYYSDFGCGFTQSFSTSSLVQDAISNVTENNVTLEAYPNPARHIVNVEITGLQQISGEIQLIDILGRVVSDTRCYSADKQINLSGLPSGVYTVVFIDNQQPNKRLTTRLLIEQ